MSHINYIIAAVYLLGQALHIWLNAVNTVRSKLNAITTYQQYFQNQGPFIVVRLFLTVASFLIVWENPAVGNLDKLAIGPTTKIGFAAFAGYGSDSLFEKLAALLGWAPELPKA